MNHHRHHRLHPDTGMIRLPCMTRLRHFYGGRYPSPTERDRCAEWQTRLHDLQRYNSPRQKRLRDERAVMSSHLDMVIFLAKAIVVFAILAIFTVLCFAL